MMPLCSSCKSEAVVTVRGETRGGRRIESLPPHGLEWGESCDLCGNVAEVSF